MNETAARRNALARSPLRQFALGAAAFACSMAFGFFTPALALQPTPQAQRAMDMSATLEQVQTFYAGATRSRFDPIHGLQIEYNAPDGRSYLWYSGNAVILAGHWRATKILAPDGLHRATRICYLYGPNTYDPGDGAHGGAWQCIPAWLGILKTKERVRGDIFGLSRSARPPFILPRTEASFGDLVSRRHFGGPPPQAAPPLARASAAMPLVAPLGPRPRLDIAGCRARVGANEKDFFACMREAALAFNAANRKWMCDRERLTHRLEQAAGVQVLRTNTVCAQARD